MKPFHRLLRALQRGPSPLRTPRLRLVAITPALLQADAAGPAPLARALHARATAEWPPEHWEPHVLEFIRSQLRDHPDTAGFHRYVLLCGPRGSRTLIGCLGAFPKSHGDVELGYSTLPAFQRQGFATEAVRALIPFLFRNAAVASVSAQTFLTLPESIKVMERNGLSPAGPGDEPGTVRYRRAR